MESIISQPTCWIDLNSETTLQEILKLSFIDKVLIFKHSTRCSISFMAKNMVSAQSKYISERKKLKNRQIDKV